MQLGSSSEVTASNSLLQTRCPWGQGSAGKRNERNQVRVYSEPWETGPWAARIYNVPEDDGNEILWLISFSNVGIFSTPLQVHKSMDWT